MHSIWQDARYGMRGLRNEPGFTALVVLTLALGIGSATAIFSVIYNILLDPFPYTDASRVVTIEMHDLKSSRPGGNSSFRPPEFLEYVEQNHVFEDVIGGEWEDVLYDAGEGMELLNGGIVTANLFQFLGVPALFGRTTTPEDAKPGAPPVFVLSYKAWVKQFNRDPNIVGRTYVLNNVPTTLVGIMPKRFTKLAADLWRPVMVDRRNPELKDKYFWFQARVKRGVTLQQVQADIDVIAHRLARQYPKNYPEQFTVQVETWLDSLVGSFRTTLYTLAAAVALLLLIACSNVANMLLARATAREKEMAIRAALGARRTRLIQQLLVESFLLALAGAVVGCVLAFVGLKAVVALIPDGAIPREVDIRLNVPVLLFSLAAAAFTAVLFGLVPALHAAKRDVQEALKDTGRSVSGGFRRGRLRNALVVVQTALSLVLLAGAGLLMRSFVRLQQVDLGFNPDRILVAGMWRPRGQYETAAAKAQFFRQVLQRVQAIPGVISAAESRHYPPYGGIGSDIQIPGKTHGEKWRAMFRLCGEGYFPALRLKLLRGRTFTEGEVVDARRLAVINQALATKYFGQEDPLGQRIKIDELATNPVVRIQDPVFEIVGVIADARNRGIKEPVFPEIVIPYTVVGALNRITLLVRTAGEPLAMRHTIQHEIWAVDRNVPMIFADSLANELKTSFYAEPRFALTLLAVFAGVGLMLVAIGVYSVVAYTVSQQTHEIGIRMALGAEPTQVLGMVLLMGARLVLFGAAAGVLASFAATRVLASQLWSVSPHDPLTLTGVVAVIAVAGMLACYLPARRATRMDPMLALRSQ
jgi:predicted permease